MKTKFDQYSLRARVWPVYLTIAPLVLLLAAIMPEGLNLQLSGASIIVFVPLAFLASQLGADFGKKLENQLWHKWDGPPTTRFLRHHNQEFNEVTRTRVHEKLKSLGLHVPTEVDQQNDLQRADAHFESCTEELIRRTRNKGQFPLVFKGLTEYGFRRNLLGLKTFGLLITLVSLIGCSLGVLYSWFIEGKIAAVEIVAGLLTIGFFLSWIIWVNEDTVHLAAKRYARFLLEAALEVE